MATSDPSNHSMQRCFGMQGLGSDSSKLVSTVRCLKGRYWRFIGPGRAFNWPQLGHCPGEGSPIPSKRARVKLINCKIVIHISNPFCILLCSQSQLFMCCNKKISFTCVRCFISISLETLYYIKVYTGMPGLLLCASKFICFCHVAFYYSSL